MLFGIDAQTLEIRAVEVITNSVADAPMLPAQPEQIPPLVNLGADGAYDTKPCYAVVACRGASTLIPVRNNVRP